MQIGSAVHAGDLKLPSGVALAAEPDLLVLHVLAAPTAEQVEADLGEEVAEAEAPAVPEAPAAAAAASTEGQESESA